MPNQNEKCVRCGKECHTIVEEDGEKYCCVRCCKDVKKKKEGAKVCKFC